jgi:clan AA aspartic protease
MGIVYAPITLSNPRYDDLLPISVEALVDTGSMFSCVPEHIAIQLRFETIEHREVTLADGSRRVCPYVGPIHLRFGNRSCFTGALVLGDQVLMGVIPMEDMDLVVSPLTRQLGPNPLSPNIPSSIAKIVAPESSVVSATMRQKTIWPSSSKLSIRSHSTFGFLNDIRQHCL